jgi:hypothetical protein
LKAGVPAVVTFCDGVESHSRNSEPVHPRQIGCLTGTEPVFPGAELLGRARSFKPQIRLLLVAPLTLRPLLRGSKMPSGLISRVG